jgi:metallo-beta-lactamase family protein
MTLPRLTFHGAARGVTGSCHRLETRGGTVLIDCGMFQGSKSEKELNYRPMPFDARRIDAVLLTHAHIDHSGLLPKLVKEGFDGPIHATVATVDLVGIMLPDSSHIQRSEVHYLNRRNIRRGGQEVQPIYGDADVRKCLSQCRATQLDIWVDVLPGMRARFWNAGHLLGSASIEVEVDIGEGAPMRLLFSGDIGPNAKLLHADPEGPSGLDYVICESTYGDEARGGAHGGATGPARRKLLCKEVRDAFHPGGVLIIPSFAVERAQELISDLSQLMQEAELPDIPIYVDSPMATRATEVFEKHIEDLEGGAPLARALRAHRVNFTESVEASKALEHVEGFHIIIAASGMCEAGRIRHHLKNWLWNRKGTVLIVGFQAGGTLGRILLNGAGKVRIQGEEISVRARIRSLDLYSGHADGPQLRAWVKARLPIAHDLFMVHGEDDAIAGLRARLDGVIDDARLQDPALDETWELTARGARALPMETVPRLAPDKVARFDWHNDASKLILDINDALAAEVDEKHRAVLIHRLTRALEG